MTHFFTHSMFNFDYFVDVACLFDNNWIDTFASFNVQALACICGDMKNKNARIYLFYIISVESNIFMHCISFESVCQHAISIEHFAIELVKLELMVLAEHHDIDGCCKRCTNKWMKALWIWSSQWCSHNSIKKNILDSHRRSFLARSPKLLLYRKPIYFIYFHYEKPIHILLLDERWNDAFISIPNHVYSLFFCALVIAEY